MLSCGRKGTDVTKITHLVSFFQVSLRYFDSGSHASLPEFDATVSLCEKTMNSPVRFLAAILCSTALVPLTVTSIRAACSTPGSTYTADGGSDCVASAPVTFDSNGVSTVTVVEDSSLTISGGDVTVINSRNPPSAGARGYAIRLGADGSSNNEFTIDGGNLTIAGLNRLGVGLDVAGAGNIATVRGQTTVQSTAANTRLVTPTDGGTVNFEGAAIFSATGSGSQHVNADRGSLTFGDTSLFTGVGGLRLTNRSDATFDGASTIDLTAGNGLTLLNSSATFNDTLDLSVAANSARGIFTNGVGVEMKSSGVTNIRTTGSAAHAVQVNSDEALVALGDGSQSLVSNQNTVVLAAGSNVTTTATNADAIRVLNTTSNSSITIDGAINAGRDGIYTISQGGATKTAIISIGTTGRIDAGRFAIRDEDGSAQVTVDGTVLGTSVLGANDDQFTVNSGGVVIGDVLLGVGDDVFTLNDGARLTGDIQNGAGASSIAILGNWSGGARLGGGSDVLTLDAVSLETISDLDGGADTGDILTFSGGTSGTVNGAVSNWETIDVQSGSTLRFGERVSSTLTTIQAGAAIQVFGGTTRFSGDVINNGLIDLGNGSVGDRVEFAGDYSSSGRLRFDVDYATNSADTLYIAGSALGRSTIEVADVSSGAANGFDVVLVQVDGTISADAFVFAGQSSYEVGAYRYEFEIVGNTVVLVGELGPAGATYGVTGSVLGGAFNNLPTLRERVGARSQVAGRPTWVRFYGDNAKRGFNTGIRSDGDFWGVQLGADFAVEEGDLGQWVLGLTAQYGKLSATITNRTSVFTGGIDASGYGLGATATYYGISGGYVDAQVQANWLETDISSSILGETASGERSTLFAASLEFGQRFALSENTSIVPQFQFTWGRVDMGNFVDRQDNSIDLGTQESSSGRIGVAYEYAIDDRLQAYVVGSLIRDFVYDGDAVTVAGTQLSNVASNSKRVELSLGGEVGLFGNANLYGEVAYSTGFDRTADIKTENFNGTVGLRFLF